MNAAAAARSGSPAGRYYDAAYLLPGLRSIPVEIAALAPLSSGHGISNLSPGDTDIVRHPAVLLAEDFESPKASFSTALAKTQ